MRKRPLYLPLALLVLGASAQAADPTTACKLYGPIFGVDPIGGTLLLKDSGGYLHNVKLPSGAAISKLPVTPGGSVVMVGSADLNIGDLVCSHGDSETSPKLSVVSRADLHRAQSGFLVSWQRDSLYGTLASIDVNGRSLVVKQLPPSTSDTPIRVSLPPTVRLRTAAADARRITESTSFALGDLKVGEPVYVRGARSSDGASMSASLVL
jgi:hypothetical protein